MDTPKQHRYVSLVGPEAWPGLAQAVAAGTDALSAAEYEGWPPAPLASCGPVRARGGSAVAIRARWRHASRD